MLNSMQVTLTRHAQELLNEELARTGSSPEQVIERALEQLTGRQRGTDSPRKTPAEAVADIRELRQGVTLGGLKVTDLIREGRKY
jgi:hypothetical protein